MAARWIAIGLYATLILATLPVAPRIGRAVLATAPGAWGMGRGAVVVAAAGSMALVVLFARRRAAWTAWGLLAVAAAGYALGLVWLRTQRIERVHLPEYGLASWLAWRAVSPMVGGARSAYVLAGLMAAGLGFGDELLQGLVPGRYYDVRDVAANALGAALGVVLVAAVRESR